MDLFHLRTHFLCLERVGSWRQFKTNRRASKGSDGIQQGQKHGPQGYTYRSALLIRTRICFIDVSPLTPAQPAGRWVDQFI